MKIKTNILKLWMVLLIFAFPACDEDYLDRDIQIRYTYDDITTYTALLNGNGMASYRYLRQWTSLGNNALLANACDEADFAIKAAAVQRFNTGGWNQFTNPDEVMAWYYRGIVQTFEFLRNSENFKDILLNDTLTIQSKTQYVRDCDEMFKLRAENHFLRAWFYFELIKRYGGVAILTSPLALNETNMPPRSSFEECVDTILKELDIAYPDMVNTWFNYDIAGPNAAIGSGKGLTTTTDRDKLGRAEKVAVKALKLRVLLYAASPLYNPGASATNDPKWLAAAAAGHDFLTDPTLVPWRTLNTVYKELFDGSKPDLLTSRATTATTGSEIIFTIYSNTGYNTSNFELWNYPISIPKGGTNITAPSQNLVDAFEMKANGLAIDDPLSGYDSLAPYTGRDPRLDAMIAVNGSIFGKDVGGANHVVKSYDGGIDGIGVKTGASTTGYYLKKFCRTDFDLSTNPTTIKSYPAIRYAEILLNYAEAMNEAYGADAKPTIAGTPALYSATEALNLVRARSTMPPVPTGLSQADFRKKLQNERRVELAFEEHRFFDVRRWKIAETTENMPLMGMNVVPVDPFNPVAFTYHKFKVEDRTFDASKMYFYPISEAQVAINGWTQNEGW